MAKETAIAFFRAVHCFDCCSVSSVNWCIRHSLNVINRRTKSFGLGWSCFGESSWQFYHSSFFNYSRSLLSQPTLIYDPPVQLWVFSTSIRWSRYTLRASTTTLKCQKVLRMLDDEGDIPYIELTFVGITTLVFNILSRLKPQPTPPVKKIITTWKNLITNNSMGCQHELINSLTQYAENIDKNCVTRLGVSNTCLYLVVQLIYTLTTCYLIKCVASPLGMTKNRNICSVLVQTRA